LGGFGVGSWWAAGAVFGRSEAKTGPVTSITGFRFIREGLGKSIEGEDLVKVLSGITARKPSRGGGRCIPDSGPPLWPTGRKQGSGVQKLLYRDSQKTGQGSLQCGVCAQEEREERGEEFKEGYSMSHASLEYLKGVLIGGEGEPGLFNRERKGEGEGGVLLRTL